MVACFVLGGAYCYIYFLGPVWKLLINVIVFHLGQYMHFSIVERSVGIV